ncbi:DNA cytosine methyltransferase [Paenibacillus jamilae]|uniref:DNA cytosine methyltransferase n=1 Tax=Paenibacillus jamilae TaxID=114136 RepID=UPI003D28BA9B
MMTIANHTPNPQDGRYSSRYLSRKRVVNWDEAAYTVLASARDASLHPGERKETVSIRNYDVTPQLPPNGLTVAELFCGGGLMAVGLKSAGYTLTFANDFDKRAAQAYAHNIGDHVVCGDITSDEVQAQIPDADIIAGGPPCQDYSVAGSGAGEEGERGKLVWTYLSIIERKQPKAFVFENVKGLSYKKHRHTLDVLLQRFDEIGYSVSWKLINAWDYGVAQKRERVFIVGIRKDLGFTFEFPEPTAEEYRTQVLRDVIGDLPEPHGKQLSEKALDYMERDSRHYQKHKPAEYNKPAPTLPAVLHKGVPYGLFFPENHNEPKYTSVSPSKHDNPSSWDEPAKTVVASTTGGKNAFYPDNHEGGVPTNIYPGHTGTTIEEAAKTITSGGNSVGGGMNCLRPLDYPRSKPRRFTVRECLRIQSVPDRYVLPDDISLSAQYRIVGNGVASRVSYLIGVALAEQLNAALAQDLQEVA